MQPARGDDVREELGKDVEHGEKTSAVGRRAKRWACLSQMVWCWESGTAAESGFSWAGKMRLRLEVSRRLVEHKSDRPEHVAGTRAGQLTAPQAGQARATACGLPHSVGHLGLNTGTAPPLNWVRLLVVQAAQGSGWRPPIPMYRKSGQRDQT